MIFNLFSILKKENYLLLKIKILFASDNFFAKWKCLLFESKGNKHCKISQKSRNFTKVLVVSENIAWIYVLFLALCVHIFQAYICSLMMIICLGLGFCIISSCGSIFESLWLWSSSSCIFCPRTVSPTSLWKTHRWFLCKARVNSFG